jgi:hypothetical protein
VRLCSENSIGDNMLKSALVFATLIVSTSNFASDYPSDNYSPIYFSCQVSTPQGNYRFALDAGCYHCSILTLPDSQKFYAGYHSCFVAWMVRNTSKEASCFAGSDWNNYSPYSYSIKYAGPRGAGAVATVSLNYVSKGGRTRNLLTDAVCEIDRNQDRFPDPDQNLF